jgi:hypothetical protein
MGKLILLLLVVPFTTSGQELKGNSRGKIEFAEIIIPDDSASAEALFSRAQLFISYAFSSSKDEIELVDPRKKGIIVHGVFPINIDMEKTGLSPIGSVSYVFTLECKEGKYRYVVNNFAHTYVNRAGMNLSGGRLENKDPLAPIALEAWEKVKTVTAIKVNDLVSDLKRFMSSPTTARLK